MNKLGEFSIYTPLLAVIPGMEGKVIAHRSDEKA
jgi:hypothetical protein